MDVLAAVILRDTALVTLLPQPPIMSSKLVAIAYIKGIHFSKGAHNMTFWTNPHLVVVATVSCMAILGGVPAIAAEQVGVSAAVRGDVQLIPPGENGRQAKSGSPVNFLETVLSGKDSGLQVLLLDETTFTLGPDSEITIDDMVYDPAGQDSRLIVTVAQGAFRYLSGEIAKQNPENVTIVTPMGSIGIRGTNLFAVETGGQWFFGLLGPGPKNNTGDKPGGFVFENSQGTADVRRAGYGFSVVPGGAPSAVAKIPAEILVQFAASMSEQGDTKEDDASSDEGSDQGNSSDEDKGAKQDIASKEDGPKEDGPKPDGILASAAHESGQDQAVTLISVAVQQTVAMVQHSTTNITTSTSQSTATTNAYHLIPLTYEDVYTYSGSATYVDTGVEMFAGELPCPSPCNGGVTSAELEQGFALLTTLNAGHTSIGSYDFSMAADFTNKTVSGIYDNINVSGAVTGGNAITGESLPFTIDYAGETGSFDETPYKINVVTDYNLDAGFVFLKSTGANPTVAQALMVTDTSWNDVAFGGSIVPPQ